MYGLQPVSQRNVLALQVLTLLVQNALPSKVNLKDTGGGGQLVPNLKVARTCTDDSRG